MNIVLKPAKDVRQQMEQEKIDIENQIYDYVEKCVPSIKKSIELQARALSYECSMRLSNVIAIENDKIRSIYSEAFTKLFQPLGYQFSLTYTDGSVYLNIFWKESFDNLKNPLR